MQNIIKLLVLLYRRAILSSVHYVIEIVLMRNFVPVPVQLHDFLTQLETISIEIYALNSEQFD